MSAAEFIPLCDCESSNASVLKRLHRSACFVCSRNWPQAAAMSWPFSAARSRPHRCSRRIDWNRSCRARELLSLSSPRRPN